MDNIKIKQNYEDYGRVRKAFKEFIHALVWESMDIDAGVQEEEINEHIAKYCANNQDQMIAKANTDVTKFIKSLESRYSVCMYEVDDFGNVIEETAKHMNTDNLKLALSHASDFYRKAKCPQVNIYDNETCKYIAEWN